MRESAILALGAICDGCYDRIILHMNDLYPFLVAQLQSEKVRAPPKARINENRLKYGALPAGRLESMQTGLYKALKTGIQRCTPH